MTDMHFFRNGAALMLAGTVAAGPLAAAGPIEGCYVRDYSDAHLAKNPDQVVAQMVMQVYHQAGGDTVAALQVLTARQGHVLKSGHAGQRFRQFLFCWSEGGVPICGVECDGGTLTVTRQGPDGLTLRTDYLMVGETGECGGAVDLAERPGQAVDYRLDRVSQSVCDSAF